MVVTAAITPETPEAPHIQENATPDGIPPVGIWADLFVNLKDLVAEKPKNGASPLLDLLGVPLVLLAVRSEDGKSGDMDVVKRDGVTLDENSDLVYDHTQVQTMAVPRGGMRVLAAAAQKANGRNIVITPFKKAKGIGFE